MVALCTMVIDILHRKLAEPGDDLLARSPRAGSGNSPPHEADEQVVGISTTVVIGESTHRSPKRAGEPAAPPRPI